MTARTAIDEARLRELWMADAPITEIAAEFGLSEPSIYRLKSAFGLPNRRAIGWQMLTPVDDEPTHSAPVALQSRPDWPLIQAAARRGVKPQCIAARFRVPYRDAAGVAG